MQQLYKRLPYCNCVFIHPFTLTNYYAYITPPPQINVGKLIFSVLAVVILFASNSWADVVERYNSSGTRTYSGTDDVAEAQTAGGYANGDELVISGNATHNSVVELSSTYNTFTVRSNSSDKQTIQGEANPFYKITADGDYTVNLSNVDYNGNSNQISFINQADSISGNIRINADNVSFTGFENRTIRCEDGIISGVNSQSVISFSNSGIDKYTIGASWEKGGAIGAHDLQISGGAYTFQNIYARSGGGAIGVNSLLISDGSYTFQNNNVQYYGDGGAIYANTSVTFSGDNTTATFTGNKAGTGGAIYSRGSVAFLGGSYTFQNNTTLNDTWGEGGAIYANTSVTFSGDNTTANFIGNMSKNAKGNDIYIYIFSSLSFTDQGTYSFDGGIYLDSYSTTSINQAQVTIAGRQYRPDDLTVEDTTNNYTLNSVSISNGGKLIANLDYINSLTGTFTFYGADSLITQNKGSDTATIKSSVGNGAMDLTYEAQGGVSKESIFISSGRIDIKGSMEATIEVKYGAKFSPGNSAGKLETTGDFTATAGALLIFEQEGNAYDQLVANNVTIDPTTGIDLTQFTSFAPGSVYDIIIANGTLDVKQSWIDGITDYLSSYDAMALIYNGNTVRLQSTLEAVPEPSTWALLILGAAGLMYWRKRK